MGDTPIQVVGDRYALERQLGEGGMATVWLARDTRDDRPVALKVIRPELAGALGVDRFLREVRLTAQLSHPSIVPVLDSGAFRGPDGIDLPWYAMRFLAGESLRTRLTRERQLPLEDALQITEAVAGALAAAHREGIVHRDIKPENILLADGQVFVVDFGIAKAVIETGGERLTSTGITIGTPTYMSPEQAAGDPVDARSDQYSLATTLYEMLAGEPPFSGATAQALLARRVAEPARPIRPVRSGVPELVERAVLRALERVPADRFGSVGDFAAALRGGHSSPVSSPWRHPGRVVVTAGLILTAAAAVLLQTGRRDGPEERRDPAVVALYQRGMLNLAKRTDEGSREALAAFRGAIERDSSYGAAWAGLAQAYQQAHGRRFVFPGVAGDSILRLAVEAVDRAVALDGRNPDVLFTQALVSRQVEQTDLAPVIKALRQAVAADPRPARYWHHLALALLETGAREEAIMSWHRAVANDPTYTEGLAFLALGYVWTRQYDSAAYWADSAIAVNPNYLLARQVHGNVEVERGNLARAAGDFEAFRRLSTGVEIPNGLTGSAIVAARAGRRAEAAGWLATADSLNAQYTPVPLHNAVYAAAAHAAVGNLDQAVAWLERYSPQAGAHFQLHLRCDPALDPIAAHPRFQAMLLAPRPLLPAGC